MLFLVLVEISFTRMEMNYKQFLSRATFVYTEFFNDIRAFPI